MNKKSNRKSYDIEVKKITPLELFRKIKNIPIYIVNYKRTIQVLLHLLRIKRMYSFYDVVIISHPKSGRTWFRVILDHLKIKLPYCNDNSEFKKQISYNKIETDKTQYKNKKVIFLLRDPRDIVVSAYLDAIQRSKIFEGTISEFIKDDKLGIRKILNFHKVWNENKDVPKEFLYISYEDMHKNSVQTIKRIIKFIKSKDIPEDKLKEIIDFYKLENMKALEKKGHFNKQYGDIFNTSKNKKGTYNKVRKGKVGGYVNYLNEQDIAYCNKCMQEFNSLYSQDQTLSFLNKNEK
jgi:hypothetical protein